MSSDSKIVIVTMLIIGAIISAVYFYYSPNEGFWNLPSRAAVLEHVYKDSCGLEYQTPTKFLDKKCPMLGYQNQGVPVDPWGVVMSTPKYGIRGCNATVVEGFNQQNDYLKLDSNDINSALLNKSPQGEMTPYTNSYSFDFNLPQQMDNDYKNDGNQCGCEDDENMESFLTEDGQLKQPIVYDRYVYANRCSRLRAMGDPIRGDLPIVPNSGNWFVPAVNPNIDLQAGAINVMAGLNNETNHQLASLIFASSGGTETNIGGIDMMPLGGINAFSRMNTVDNPNLGTMVCGGNVVATSFL